MTLVIENVKDEFVPSLKAFVKAINARCKAETKPKIKAQNLGKTKKAKLSEFEKEILKADRQIERDIKSGKLKAYKSAKKMHEDILNNA